MVISKFEIVKEKDFPILGRKRLTIETEFSDITPSNAEVKKKIAEITKVNENLIAIRHIYQHYGIRAAKIIAHLYNDEKTLKHLEKDKGKKEIQKAKETEKPS